jgi:hypothetical protein
MEYTKQLDNCIDLANIIKNINFTKLLEYIQELETSNSMFKKEIQEKDKIISDLTKELKQKGDDMSNLTKVSMVQNLNKQLNEKINYITILESQLEKLKNNSNKDTVFNPDDFEDINGYELMMYKNKYYLRDLETNELYNIMNNKPEKIVGFINTKGKPKFN